MAASRFETLFNTSETYAKALENIYELKPEVSFKVVDDDYIIQHNEQAQNELKTLNSLTFEMFSNEAGVFNTNAFESKLKSINLNFTIDSRMDDKRELFDAAIKNAQAKYQNLCTGVDQFRESYMEKIEPNKSSLNQLLLNAKPNAKVNPKLVDYVKIQYFKMFESKYVSMNDHDEKFMTEHTISVNLSKLDVSQHIGQSVFVTINTGLIFSVSQKYILFVYPKENNSKECYIQPICIDGRDKGPMFLHIYINNVQENQLKDELLTMQFFSAAITLVATQGSTSLAQKDRSNPNNSIWNMNVPAIQFVSPIEKHNPIDTVPGISFNPPNAASIEMGKASFIILPRKRCMLNDTIFTVGGCMPNTPFVEPKCVTLNPNELKIVCVTSPSKRNQFTLAETKVFTFKSNIIGLNGNYADLPKYKEFMKKIKKTTTIQNGTNACEKYATSLQNEYSLTDEQKERVFKILKMINPNSLCDSNSKFKKIVTAAKSDAVLDKYFITQLLSVKPDKLSLDDTMASNEKELQHFYDEYETLNNKRKNQDLDENSNKKSKLM